MMNKSDSSFDICTVWQDNAKLVRRRSQQKAEKEVKGDLSSVQII